MDNRAQSIGLAQGGLALVVGAIMLFLVSRVGTMILPGATNATSNTQANQATAWFQSFTELLPIIIVLIVFFSTVVYAIFRRQVR